MPKQHHTNGTPGKKPPAPSVKVWMAREQRRALELLAGSRLPAARR
jgi:hypothetical protein